MTSLRQCSIKGCSQPYYARSWCKRHYDMNRRRGNPEAPRKQPAPYRDGAVCRVEGCEKPIAANWLCSMHDRRMRVHGSTDNPRPTEEQRFWAKVDKDGAEGCWLWVGSQSPWGYGVFNRAGGRGAKGTRHVHRIAYEWCVGPIPDGLEIDHLCRVPLCVNPDHLDPVTHAENNDRKPKKTHCPHGHEFTPENTKLDKAGYRHCRECTKRHAHTQYQKRKAMMKAAGTA